MKSFKNLVKVCEQYILGKVQEMENKRPVLAKKLLLVTLDEILMRVNSSVLQVGRARRRRSTDYDEVIVNPVIWR